MYDYTYFDTERNCLKSKLELMRSHLDLPYILQGVMINVSKTTKIEDQQDNQNIKGLLILEITC